MEKTDPHKTHSYSHDWMLMTAFDFELRNHISVNCEQTNEMMIIRGYLEERVKEIKERWK
jgi:hypothetical protein